MAYPIAPERFFRERYDVSDGTIERTLGSALGGRADDGDLYFEFRTTEAVLLEEQLVKRASKDVSQGVGVRVVAGDKTGYAYSDDVTVATLTEAARTAGCIATEGGDARAVAIRATRPGHELYALDSPPVDAPLADRIALARSRSIARHAATTRASRTCSRHSPSSTSWS